MRTHLDDVAFLCDAVDAAKETLRAAERGVDSASSTLEAVKKSASYLRLQAAQATVVTLTIGKELAKQGLAGWAAIDPIADRVVNGPASNLVTLKELVLSASLRSMSGTLHIAVLGRHDIADVPHRPRADHRTPARRSPGEARTGTPMDG